MRRTLYSTSLTPADRKRDTGKSITITGKSVTKGRFANDQPVGLMHKYYKGGLPQAVIRFSPDGNTSHAVLYYENGKIAAEGNYIGENKDSTWLFYSFYNGRLAIKEDYDNGEKDGLSLKYYDNGQVSEKTGWKDNRKDGIWEQYYENGELRMRSAHKDGRRDGLFETFTADGKPSVRGYYKNGVMDGTWQYYKDNGDPDFTAEYVNGKMLPNKEYEKRQNEFSKKIEEKSHEIPDSTDPDFQ